MPDRIRELLLAWAVGLPLLILDQWTKFLVLDRFNANTTIPVIDGFFNLVLVKNKGAAWGMFHGQAVGLILSKHGMGSMDPFAANQIRVTAGLAGFALIFSFGGIRARSSGSMQ